MYVCVSLSYEFRCCPARGRSRRCHLAAGVCVCMSCLCGYVSKCVAYQVFSVCARVCVQLLCALVCVCVCVTFVCIVCILTCLYLLLLSCQRDS